MDIQKLCDEAIQYQTASVCIPPCYIKRIHDTYGEKINICTVVGFPLGYSTIKAKIAEVEQALADGVNEVDMVINITDVKNGNYKKKFGRLSEQNIERGTDKIPKVF